MSSPRDTNRADERTDSENQRPVQDGGQQRGSGTQQTDGGQQTGTGGGQQTGGGQPPDRGGGANQEGAAGWFASAALRTGIVVIGFVLFLFALGQAVGFNLLDIFVTAVTSPTGRWIVVAVFALLLIAAAGKGLNRPLLGG